jgi:hypothetical protein
MNSNLIFNMKYIVILIISLSLQFSFGQTKSLNAYEYVVVPMQFNFQSEPNQYSLNILARVLLKDQGFKVYMDQEKKPLAFGLDPCNSLRANIIQENAFLTTRLKFVLLDCSNDIVYETEQGVSRLKDFKKSYNDALRDAFMSFSKANYMYDETLNGTSNLTDGLSDVMERSDLNLEEEYPDKSIYKFGGKFYWLVTNSSGDYDLLSSQGKINYAQLKKADRGSYIFNSKMINGAAYFDSEGNLMVEYMEQDLNKIQNIRFNKID